jgi:prepilin-type N-terminal cleavage/methylation domain-containing protein
MHPQPTQHTLRRAGFTLLELIGVMAVIAILSAALLPGAIDMIRVQRAVNDRAELPKIAEALKRGMLREQVFPIYENAASVSTDGNDAYWWNLAARHGGGSANAVRYPLGIRPGSTTTRKLYFAEASWSGKSFSEFTGDGLDWLNDFQDPTELRLLLISTTNPDLSLPDELDNDDKFNAFWDDWAVGSDGDPASGTWSSYGFSRTEWQGRAAELNVQRIDLRDWLCTVVIENRRAIVEASGEIFNDGSSQKTGTLLDDNWELGTVYAYTTNQVGSEIILQLEEVSVANNPYAKITNAVLTKRGRVTEEATPITIEVRGNKNTGTPPTSTPSAATITLTLTDLAPVALIIPNNPNIDLYDFENDSASIENRYFLLTQELLLKEPWNQIKVGIFTITEPFSTLRFDGLQWHY